MRAVLFVSLVALFGCEQRSKLVCTPEGFAFRKSCMQHLPARECTWNAITLELCRFE